MKEQFDVKVFHSLLVNLAFTGFILNQSERYYPVDCLKPRTSPQGLRFETKTSSQESEGNEDDDGSKPAKRSKSIEVMEKSKVELSDDERKLLEDNRMLTLMGKAKKFTEVFPQYHVYYMNYE